VAAAAAADADDVETAQIAAFVGTLDEGLETKVGLSLFLLLGGGVRGGGGRGARGGAVVVGEDGDSGSSAHTKLVVDEDGDSGDSARGGDPSRHAASPVDPACPGLFAHSRSSAF